ncbi:MAG: response regulator [Candidatus Thiodiazotropha sp.]
MDSPETLAHALTDPSWDLVITDHNMPSFDSEEVLKMVNDANGDIPVIIVSGSIGEELAVSMMKCGAADYIMKSNLTRLGAAIERELQEAKSREARRLAEDRLQHMACFAAKGRGRNRVHIYSEIPFGGFS